MSKFVDNSRDCITCRLISGFGLVGIGMYIGYNGYSRHGYSRRGILLVATAAAGLGAARLFNLPPFQKQLTDASIEESDL